MSRETMLLKTETNRSCSLSAFLTVYAPLLAAVTEVPFLFALGGGKGGGGTQLVGVFACRSTTASPASQA